MSKKLDKIKKRIEKLLAMGEDASSPKEAVIASRRARKLMDKYQIKESDLRPETAFDRKTYCEGHKGEVPVWLQILATSVGKWNDCNVGLDFRRTSRGRMEHVCFMGFKTDTMVSIYAYDYLVKTINRLRDGYRFRTTGEIDKYNEVITQVIADRIADEIEDRKEEFRTAEGKSMVVLKRAMVEKEFGVPEYNEAEPQRPPTQEEVMAVSMANLDGKTIGLNKQVEQGVSRETGDDK